MALNMWQNFNMTSILLSIWILMWDGNMIWNRTVQHLLGVLFENLNYHFKWLKMKNFWFTLCLLIEFGQNEGVKIGHLQPNRAKNQSWSNLKNKTIFPTSSSSWIQKCKNFWKNFIFWKNLPQKTSTGSPAVRFFLFKKLYLISVWFSTSLKKNCSIRFKNWKYDVLKLSQL